MKLKKNTVGVDLGGTNMVIALVDGHGKITRKSKIPTLVQEGPTAILERMSREVLRLMGASATERRQIGGIGVGSPGPLDARRGVVLKTPNLTGWKNVPLARILSKRTGFKVFLENDGNAAALGEAAYGAGKGCSQILMLTLGTGVGGGLILNGELYSGPDTTAGELGHMALDPKGPLCGCGQHGCLEQFASATAMARRAQALLSELRSGKLWELCGGNLSTVSSKMTHEALLLGDPVSRQVWAEAAWALGTAIAGYLNVFNPERVILAGGVMLGGKELLRETRRQALSLAFPQAAKRAKIVAALLGDDAGVIGAAEVARRACLKA